MKTWTWIPLSLVALLMAANIWVLTRAYQQNQSPHPPPPKIMVVEMLEFDAQQAKAFKENAQEHHRSMRQLDKKQRAWTQVYFETHGIDKQTALDSIQACLLQKLEKTETHFQYIEALCRPDQKATFPEVKEALMHRILHPGPPPNKRPPRHEPGQLH